MSFRTFEIGDNTVGINQTDTDYENGIHESVVEYYKQPFVVKNDELTALFSDVKAAQIILKTFNGVSACKIQVFFGKSNQFGRIEQDRSEYVDGINWAINLIEEYFQDDE